VNEKVGLRIAVQTVIIILKEVVVIDTIEEIAMIEIAVAIMIESVIMIENVIIVIQTDTPIEMEVIVEDMKVTVVIEKILNTEIMKVQENVNEKRVIMKRDMRKKVMVIVLVREGALMMIKRDINIVNKYQCNIIKVGASTKISIKWWLFH